MPSNLTRRSFAALAGALPALAQTQRDWTNQQTVRYPDPDIVSLDPKFGKYAMFNAAIYRHWVGAKWAEGPAWCAEGQYLLWSDIPNNRQMRILEEDAHVSTFRSPSNYSNGNTFDFQGRQLACEHAGRRVVRYESDGSVSVIADRYNGKPLSSPNDVVVHPDGSIWFTDPPYGIMGNYEGFQAKQENKEAVYRVDPQTKAVAVVTDALDKPNGLCFSPDYKKLYVVDTGDPRNIMVFDINGAKLGAGRVFSDLKYKGLSGGSDGIRADVDGNIWAAASGGPGYDGVHCFTAEGQRIGVILLPEICANLCFGGPKRNRLYMTASQSLYSVFVGTRGAHVS